MVIYEARRDLIDPRTRTRIPKGGEVPADFPGLASLLANGGARPIRDVPATPALFGRPIVEVPAGAITEGLDDAEDDDIVDWDDPKNHEAADEDAGDGEDDEY